MCVALQLADVVHQAIEQPLIVDFACAAQRESSESTAAAEVAEYRLHDSQPSSVEVAPLLGVDLALHEGTVGGWPTFGPPMEEHHLACRRSLRMLEAAITQRARGAVALGAVELDPGVAVDDHIASVSI